MFDKYMSKSNIYVNIILIIFFSIFLVFSITNKLKRQKNIQEILKI